MAVQNKELNNITHSVIRLKSGVLAFVFAMFGGFGLFTMTVLLLLQGGQNVGIHLELLSNFFWGYEVSWFGSIVGFFYGALSGWVIGWLISILYNYFVNFRTSRT